MDKIFINGNWLKGAGELFASANPITDETIWQGHTASVAQVELAIDAARDAFYSWQSLDLDERIEYLEKFVYLIDKNKQELTKILSQDTGKTLWEAQSEIASIIGKLPLAIQSYKDRCPEKSSSKENVISKLYHKPHGVCGVLGPFNFPGHLPNGHIMPALLAGNTIVLKPSELTPLISEHIMRCWDKSGIPAGVINMVQGGADVGRSLTESMGLDGLFFTGSFKTGMQIQANLSKYPQRILALEMGGNNPLIVYKSKNLHAAVYTTIQSAFITSGQRCTCARRLIVVRDRIADKFLTLLAATTENIKVGDPLSTPEPFMGSVIANASADHIMGAYNDLLDAGARVIVPMLRKKHAIITPGIIDVTEIKNRKDHEIFGPLLQVILVDDFDAAIKEANNTGYGLSAGLLSDDAACFKEFLLRSRAGIVNWNRPLTGASGSVPFGGIGKSGNYRPSAYYAADYCAYPVASMQLEELKLPEELAPGIKL
jgi:succinylglutamic semialdehyde dehydrogenase